MRVPDPAARRIDPVIGALRILDGTRRDAAACATMLTPPPLATRSRQDEVLFVLLDLTGPAPPYLYRELREVASQTFWSTSGSITSALRRTADAVNRYLFDFNLRTMSSDRCYGGLACAVLHGEDFYILQAGPVRVCVLHGGQLTSFGRDEDLPHLGMGSIASVRLHHAFAAVGDTLLLALPALTRSASFEGLARVLPRADVPEILEGLEQVGAGANFCALVARLAPPSAAPRQVAEPAGEPEPPQDQPVVSRRRTETLPTAAEVQPQPPEPRPVPGHVPTGPVSSSPARPVERREPLPSRTQPRSRRTRTGPSVGERVAAAARAAGRGIAAAGAWLGGGVVTLLRRTLPGRDRRTRRQERRPREVPKENRSVMMAIAIGIPLLVAIIVALAYNSFGKRERLNSMITRIENEVALAQAAEATPEEARPHWQAALEHAQEARQAQPDNTRVVELASQAQAALDRLDGIVRLAPVELKDFGTSTAPRQLVVQGQKAFVLDPAGGWVVQLTLDTSGTQAVDQETSGLVRTGQQVGQDTVGGLVDLTWVEPGGDRMTGGLVVLEENGVLLTYDPAWESEEGEPQLTRSFLGTWPGGTPQAVGSYSGRFYILDTTEKQILRYEPHGDTYPDPPNRYFVTAPHRPLDEAIDMAIDGDVYVLYADGEVLKFESGELQPFEVHGLPNAIDRPVALAIDPAGDSGRLYVADGGKARVIVLESDGAFCAQMQVEGSAFSNLEALAVDETTDRLYLIDSGKLYSAALP